MSPGRRGVRRCLAAALIAVALAQGAQGAWILAKAALAQRLLDAAWTRSLELGRPVRPWPWADTWPVARLGFPRLGRSLVVLAGASGEALAFGPGHITASARPGDRGNAVIAGHRDTHFDFLAELEEGDPLVLEDARGGRRDFRVLGSAVMDARDAVIPVDGDTSTLTLVACWPFDAVEPGGPLRYVVTAAAAPSPSPPGPDYPRLSRPTTKSSTSAPTVAMTMAPTIPPAAMPRASNK
jgi:sortase A